MSQSMQLESVQQGNDFCLFDGNEIDKFKQWLDQHPEKSQIKQYLITTVE